MGDASAAAAATGRRSVNPWVLHLQKLGLELKCPLCLNLLERPLLLPCDHIFCNSCLPEPGNLQSECPVCQSEYIRRDVRPVALIENVITIYRSLDAASIGLLHSAPDVRRVLGKCTTSISKQSARGFHDDNSSSGRLGHRPLVQNGPMEGGVDGSNCEQKTSSAPLASTVTAGGLQASGLTRIGMSRVDQLSPGSPPSFGDVRGSDLDSSDQGSGDSPQNYQPAKSVKWNSESRPRQEGIEQLGFGIEDDHLRDSKRQKLDYDLLDVRANNGHVKLTSQLEVKSTVVHADSSKMLGNSSERKAVCGFCQSSRISEETGPILHFINGKPVEGDKAMLSNAIHVHQICIEWAPQVYFEGETVRNLKAELARGAKLKCCRCGLKGAALGCYLKSCRRSYHVPCAMEVNDCRWDLDNFLVLCPSHTKFKFPNEKSNPDKHNLKPCLVPTHEKDNLKGGLVPTQLATCQSNFWEGLANVAKEWVLCGSALSSEDKLLLVKFGGVIGVPVTKFWRQDVTHVIAATNLEGACTRTLKVLMAILNGGWVLTMDWVKACVKSMHPVDEEPYEINLDNHGSCGGPKTARLSILDNAPKLFNGLNFYFFGDFVSGYKKDLQNLVTTAGGTLLETEEQVEQACDQGTPTTTLIVYNDEPPHGCMLGDEVSIIWQRLSEAQDLAAKVGSQVIAHTWLLESIAAYRLQPLVS